MPEEDPHTAAKYLRVHGELQSDFAKAPTKAPRYICDPEPSVADRLAPKQIGGIGHLAKRSGRVASTAVAAHVHARVVGGFYSVQL